MAVYEKDNDKSLKGWVADEEEIIKNETITTNWRAVIVTSVLFFFVGIESAFVGTSEWPYMHTIDKDATYSFYGLSISISNWGNVGCSMLFALWSYKFNTVRWPILFGRILAFLGSCLYVCVELFPTNKRFVMLACYIDFSIAKSSSVVLRAYMVMMSSNADRSRAFALISLSTMISIVIGPLVQLAFSGIHYPGYEILPSIRFNLFSAPIWLATITNFITIVVVIVLLPELPKKKQSKEEKEPFSPIQTIKERWRKIKSLDVAWLLIVVVLVCRLFIAFAISTVASVITPIFMTSFGWDNVTTVRWISISMGIVGLLSIGVALLFTVSPISKLIASRTQLLIAFCTAILMYIASFPYPFLSTPMPPGNVTTGTGCAPSEFSWCDSARAPYPYIFIPVVLLAVGIALPTGQISMDTIFSKVVGDANQNLTQCLVVFIDDITGILSPLYSSQIFSAAGLSILWICNGVIAIIGTAVWSIFYRKMKNY